MTTIAWDGRTLAADTKILLNNMPVTGKKIWASEHGLFGLAGDTSIEKKVRRFTLEQLNEAMPAEWFEDACLIWVNESGAFVSVCGEWFQVKAPFAIGSGKEFAIAAMDFGKTAKEAVVYAMTRNADTGGGVTTLVFTEPNPTHDIWLI